MKIKNFFIKLFLAFCTPFVKRHSGERFLIVSTTGLGDTLWGTPAIRALRQSFPQAYIGVLTSSIGKEVLQNNPHIDELFEMQKPPLLSFLKLFPRLKKRKIATVLIFHLSQRPVLPLCTLLGATQIIGTENINKGLDFLLTQKLKRDPIHEIERRLGIAAAAGAKISPAASPQWNSYGTEWRENSTRWMEFFPLTTHQQEARSLLPPGVVIGFHPGAKDRFKQWAPSHFIELGLRLKEAIDCQIIITGTSSEKQIVESIARAIPEARAIVEGVTLPTLAALLQNLSLYITNDTGPLHIASAMRTPTIALFAPTDPLLCGPYFAPHLQLIQKRPTCSPCLRKKCQDPFCMLQISPQEVLQMALPLLRGAT